MKKLILLILVLLPSSLVNGQGFENFITVSGDRLMDGNKPFRFISFNVPTLNYQEDVMDFKVTNPYALPDEFEMRDVFATVKEMGGQVIRFYTIPVRNKNFPAESPTYVESPGVFNEEAFKVTDKMLALANEYHVRIIFSFLNNWQWMGGRPNYAAFRGKTENDFWTDPQLIDDFKKTIAFTINRKNTVTGVAYKDDKAILCWETGNELTSPVDWTIKITRYIKSLDKKHLVMDGYYAIDDRPVREESIVEPSIDILSSHHYETNTFDIPPHIMNNLALIKGRKPYLVGEFGFSSSSALANVLDTVIQNKGICGALIWSLRHHRRQGGFYWHSEPMGLGIYKAYHFPGFSSGTEYDETDLLKMYRQKAFQIQGVELPALSIPKAPVLLPIEEAYAISWQGSAGASGYSVERADNPNGAWLPIANNVSDAEVPYFPLFHDATAKIGGNYYYRIKALNNSGISEASNVVGPVLVQKLAVIDKMKNIGVLYQSKNVKLVTGSDRSFKEIRDRLQGDSGSEIYYSVPGSLSSLNIYSFEQNRSSYLTVSGSNDTKNWEVINIELQSYLNNESNYAYWIPKLYSYSGEKKYKFFKISFSGVAQIGRVEIMYTE
ncbi:MAG: hypothetical protein LLF95_10305 [Bacteroidales bacterium]|nr:hypothetical protein [Bacteroidales bacterium]